MKRFLKTFIFLFLLFFIVEATFVILFLISPNKFYFRPWEYFDKVTYHNKVFPSKWNQVEIAEDSRGNFFFFQDSRKTIVTTDQFGFRISTKMKNVPININGDSMIFGSYLSDDEVISSVLEKELSVPVLNTGRTNYLNAAAHPKSQNIKLFLECRKERILLKINGKLEEIFSPLITNKQHSPFDILDIASPKRYLFAFKIIKYLEQIGNDITVLINRDFNKNKFLEIKLHYNQDYKGIALEIEKRFKYFQTKGIKYFFCPIPTRNTIYSLDPNYIGKNYLPTLYKELKARGIPYIDLYTPFMKNKDLKLYYDYDSHWNINGVNLATKIIKKEIEPYL